MYPKAMSFGTDQWEQNRNSARQVYKNATRTSPVHTVLHRQFTGTATRPLDHPLSLQHDIDALNLPYTLRSHFYWLCRRFDVRIL